MFFSANHIPFPFSASFAGYAEIKDESLRSAVTKNESYVSKEGFELHLEVHCIVRTKST
jgi:hypothetical protein